MEKLLQMAKQFSDQAEVYSRESTYNSVSFQDSKLHDLDSVFQSGVSLRIIKDGKLGFAYTRNLIDRQELLDNALTSLEGGVEANYQLPLTNTLSRLATYDPLLESLPNGKMVEECARLCDLLKSQTDGEIFLGSSSQVRSIRIINSRGTDISFKSSSYELQGNIIYPGSGSGIWRNFLNLRFEKTPDDLIREMIQLYQQSSKVVEPKGGRMKVFSTGSISIESKNTSFSVPTTLYLLFPCLSFIGYNNVKSTNVILFFVFAFRFTYLEQSFLGLFYV